MIIVRHSTTLNSVQVKLTSHHFQMSSGHVGNANYKILILLHIAHEFELSNHLKVLCNLSSVLLVDSHFSHK